MTTWTPRPNVPGNCRYFIVIGFTFFRVVDVWRNSCCLWLFPMLRLGQIKKFCSLGAIFLVFLLYSPLLHSALQHFCHYCSRFDTGRIKNPLQGIPSDNLSQDASKKSFAGTKWALPSLLRKPKPMCIPLTQCEAQANQLYYWSSQTLLSDGFQVSENWTSKCELVNQGLFYS